jgi:hypothetical protein
MASSFCLVDGVAMQFRLERLSGLRSLNLGIPRCVRRVLCQMPIEVLCTVSPPSGTALTHGDLGRVDSSASSGHPFWIFGPTSSFDLASRVHEITHELGVNFWSKAWIGRAPKTATNNDVPGIRGREWFQGGLPFDMSGRRKQSKRDFCCPLDGGIRPHAVRRLVVHEETSACCRDHFRSSSYCSAPSIGRSHGSRRLTQSS